jgi:predicted dinucleotide-binding enzyme
MPGTPSARSHPKRSRRRRTCCSSHVSTQGLAAALERTGATGGSFDSKPVLTCVSALRPDFSGVTVGLPTDRTASVAEEIAARAPGARVVEAFNTTFAEVIARGPGFDGLVKDGGPPSLFYCGDDAAAKDTAAALIRDCGFDPVDAGPLSVARSQETLASVSGAVRRRLRPLSGRGPEGAPRLRPGAPRFPGEGWRPCG